MAEQKTDQQKPHQLVLVKHEHRWVFQYSTGDEQAVLEWLADKARDPESDFNWFDAAVLSHQMGDQLHAQLKNIMIMDDSVDFHATS